MSSSFFYLKKLIIEIQWQLLSFEKTMQYSQNIIGTNHWVKIVVVHNVVSNQFVRKISIRIVILISIMKKSFSRNARFSFVNGQ